MITVRELIFANEPVGFVISGHSDYGIAGEDIVCAAVSALSDTAVLALEHLVGAEPEFIEEDGFLSCRIKTSLDLDTLAKAQLILKTMLLGIKNIAEQYPVLFILEKEEV